MTCRAVPLFFKSGASVPKTRLVEMSSVDGRRLVAVLQSIFGSSWKQQRSGGGDENGFVEMSLRCDLGKSKSLIPSITLLGILPLGGRKECVVAHCPGLDGAFPISLHELERFRQRIQFRDEVEDEADADPSLDRCVSQAVISAVAHGDGDGVGCVLQELLFECRKHAVALHGMARLVEGASLLRQHKERHPANYSFPYHCSSSPLSAKRSATGSGPAPSLTPAEKKYFDVSDAKCAVMHDNGRHGAKILTPFGVATCIGIAECHIFGDATMFWHPAGEVAGRFAPILHGCRSIVVGQSKLECNGPGPNSQLCLAEDVHRYLNPTLHVTTAVDGHEEDVAIDVTKWMNKGLFDCLPGQPYPGSGSECVGVGYNARRGMLDVYCRKSDTGVTSPSFELI